MTDRDQETLVQYHYAATGQSVVNDALGMRPMQRRAYALRQEQYLLLKAPPASGKSRALMFIALDKLANQGIKKVIVAVPETMIGKSFQATDLTGGGFFADWTPDLDLIGGDSTAKTEALRQFLTEPRGRIAVCTHATLRAAFKKLHSPAALNDTLLAIDEFHHSSADSVSNELGRLIHTVMTETTAHIAAMTGSYFRGDGVAVILPEDEARFRSMTFTYYDQLSGYTYLKSLEIGFHFYQGKYTSAIGKVLDTNEKTLIHIPHVQSREATGNKREEVDAIFDVVGEIVSRDKTTGVVTLRRSDGKLIKAADLVEDDPRERAKIDKYLREAKGTEAIDLIVALGKAREGFDWPECRHALTVGYRGSLNEVIQIIGRCTRDCPGKTIARFTNLIAQPDAEDQELTEAVNNFLKAIACSLLMEQVLAPRYDFRPRLPDSGELPPPGTIQVTGMGSATPRVSRIVESDMEDLAAKLLQDPRVQRAGMDRDPARMINNVLIPAILKELHPELNDEEIEALRQRVVLRLVTASHPIVEQPPAGAGGAADGGPDGSLPQPPHGGDIESGEDFARDREDRRFIQLAGRFINVQELSIDLIDSVNPFERALEILSKTLNAKTFRLIHDVIRQSRIPMDTERAMALWPEIQAFKRTFGRKPELGAESAIERELAAALVFLKNLRREEGI